MAQEGEGRAQPHDRVNAYLDTIKRLEPDIANVDHDAAMASIAISLKRIADALEASQGIVRSEDVSPHLRGPRR